MPGLDIVDRLRLLARGDNLDLVDIVCADAIAEIESLRKQWADMACRIFTQAQQTNAMVKDASDRIDAIERR